MIMTDMPDWMRWFIVPAAALLTVIFVRIHLFPVRKRIHSLKLNDGKTAEVFRTDLPGVSYEMLIDGTPYNVIRFGSCGHDLYAVNQRTGAASVYGFFTERNGLLFQKQPMNVAHLIEAVKCIEAAEMATMNKELESIGEKLRAILRRHGVFIGDAGCDKCGVNDRLPGQRICKQCSETK